MKKYACLLLFALLLNGCDDGDLTVETFDFDNPDIKIENCTDTYELLYKLKNQESLLLQMPEDKLENVAGEQTFDIDNINYRLVYRTYDGTVAKTNICDAIRPSLPNVTDEWYAKNGTIVIVTKAKYGPPNTTENSTRIVGYTHSISFKNLTYSKPAGKQVGPDFVFGDIDTTVDGLDLTFDESADLCTSTTNGKVVYNFDDVTSLMINNIDPALIANETTPSGTPRTGLISPTQNRVVYNVYNGFIPTDYFCKTPIPSSPAITQTWTGLDGVAGQTGIIEVTTTSVGPGVFKHVIILRDVILDNGNVNFKLGNSFLLGELFTTSN
ncbi:hypothetical protein [Flavobacterium limi]|uniref:Lipoprotein n=1 Tax=Flavobacterium limi TaxID=2045105 RepID=A0ABQ1UID0_9FLAO|nr:hypothetical protein [Flavobacterium limi]GGF17175.1 hypothetical protein GCM10011518_28230 [Flavobacterium limi]